MPQIISEIDHWLRQGRGKTFQFSATAKEVAELLRKTLPSQFAPYSLLGIVMVKEGKYYKQVCRVATIADFPLLRAEGIWQFFIYSQVLSHELPIKESSDLEGLCATNGLINLQQSYVNQVLLQETNIGMIDKVKNTLTGEIREHSDYLKIFHIIKDIAKSQNKLTSSKKSGRYGQAKTAFASSLPRMTSVRGT
jgi:hypothetical protein